MNNMQQMFARAQKLQAKVAEVQKDLELKEVSGSSGAGAVTIVMTVSGIVKSISIDKSLVNPDEKDLLEDLIIAALGDARTTASKIYEAEMSAATGGLNLPGMF
ncbi:MAG: YbaB/EbfC family nucleoid-associated protein [Holosporales bacterium]|jgi:DNA-binding YbaB/EbfC family protein|nr:YbaB/EbfC family nucleoid-associated protein [Holosporales bacterium]